MVRGDTRRRAHSFNAGTQVAVVDDERNIQNLIRTVRGVQVMLDRDMARLYGVETGALNRQVKRNQERFPEDFMFRLSVEEWENLKCQNGISSWGGDRQLPYAFTENGIAMLSGVLRSEIAIEVNIRIMRAFTAMRRFMLANAQMFQRIESVEKRQIATDAKVDEILERLDSSERPVQGIFYDGQLWDARVLMLKLVSSAKRSILLIDNWVTVATLDLFAKKRKGVKVTIVTSEHYREKVPHHTISDSDIETFNGQYPKPTVRYNEIFHDRFLIIDDKELYLIGASLKDLGSKCFGFTKMDAAEIPRIKKSAFETVDNPDANEISCTTGVKESSLLDDISGLADSLKALYKQSYDILLPVVDDMCRRKETVTQDELDHCFDSVSEIACTDFGKKLFDRLCAAFKSKYPESVNFYTKDYEKLYGDGEEDDDDKVSKVKRCKCRSRAGNGKKGGLK